MRYLWVEDFNDGSETGDELKEHLVNFFDLQDDKLVIKNDLSTAIDYLENRDNFSDIDAILIDIRFPLGSNKDIYEKYFKDIVTLKFYENNIDSASGIMLYLLLVFRYHFSQKKMAFVSANIGNSNQKLAVLQDMVEIIVKSKYEELSYNEKKEYRTLERNLGSEILNISSKEKSWKTFISNEDVLQTIDKEELIKTLQLLPQAFAEKFEVEEVGKETKNKSMIQYQLVKNQFEKIGFVMPVAFEKPKIGEKSGKKYSFIQWEYELYSNPYISVRSNVLEMLNILEGEITDNFAKNGLVKSFLSLLTCNLDELSYYDADFFLSYIRDMKALFGIEKFDDSEYNCSLILKEMSGLWEASSIPFYDNEKESGKYSYNKKIYVKDDKNGTYFCYNENQLYACHATMKIARNWIGHQGIMNINILDIGFLMIINLRGIFEIEKMSGELRIKYIEYEKKIMDSINSGVAVEVELEKSLEYFCDLNNKTNETKGKGNSREIYDRISGLGHLNSKIRRMVNMDEIYMLFYHAISKEKITNNELKNLVESVKGRTWDKWKERYNKRFKEHAYIN